MNKTIFIVVAGLFVCGCAALAPMASTVAGPLGAQPAQALTQTYVYLSENNFVLIRTNVVGTSKGFSLFGLIPLYSATVTKATGRLYANGGMQEGESKSMAHVIIEHSSLYFVLFSIPKTTVRADIIEFIPKTEQEKSHKMDSSGARMDLFVRATF